MNMQMAAAGWSPVRGRKVFASMRRQPRTPVLRTDQKGANNACESCPPSPHNLVATDELCQRRIQTQNGS